LPGSWKKNSFILEIKSTVKETDYTLHQNNKDGIDLADRSATFIESIINASPDIIYIYDIVKRKNVFVNDGIQRNLGYTDEEIKQMGSQVIPQLMFPGDFNYYLHTTFPKYATLKDKEIITHEYRMRDKEGNWHWLFCKESIFLRNTDGSPRQIFGVSSDITEKKETELRLDSETRKKNLLLDNAQDGIFVLDSDFCVVETNKAFAKMLGLTPEATIGTYPWNWDIIYSTKEILNKTWTEFLMTKSKFETKIRHCDETIFDAEITGSPSEADWEGQKLMLFICRDITERKKAEERIRQSEEKYRILVEQASDAIFIADTAGRFISVNSSACKLSQYSEAELLQMSIYDFAVLEDIQREPFHFDELKKGKTVITQRVMKRKNSEPLQVEVNAKLLTDGRLLTFIRDISERIKTQNEIIREKNLSDSIINTLPGVFYLYTRDGKFLRWNKNFEKVTGYRADEIRNMHPLDFFDENEKELLSQKIGNVFIAGADNVQASFLLKNKEKIPYYFTGVVTDYEGSPCLLGVGIDFSERVEAQEKIKETSHQLRSLTAHLQTIREEERKRIGREIHDELGQQLTAIKMDVAWVDKKTPDEATLIKSKLKNVLTLLDGSNQSIRRILSELRPGILDSHDLPEAMEWLSRQFTASTNIPVKLTSEKNKIIVSEAIATCIFRIYQEALTNITRHAEAATVYSSLSLEGNDIVVSVEDDGKGFDKNSLETKKSFGILGIKERVLSLGGLFELHSVPGNGTKIMIRLPYIVSKNI
jgi:PAS domain S-box-containing protein